jgi:nucleotide-binding universal stress UspA family protein
MHGTLVCAVTDGAESDDAVALATAVSERLGLRLVLAHVVDGIAALGNGDGDESVTMKSDRQAAERRLDELARNHGVIESAELRLAVGEPATLVGQIAAEEAADVIVGGARARGWRKRFESRLADELETETPVPVLIAPPRARRRRNDEARRENGANVAA